MCVFNRITHFFIIFLLRKLPLQSLVDKFYNRKKRSWGNKRSCEVRHICMRRQKNVILDKGIFRPPTSRSQSATYGQKRDVYLKLARSCNTRWIDSVGARGVPHHHSYPLVLWSCSILLSSLLVVLVQTV